MKKVLICLLALASASYATAQPKDAAHPDWEKEIPRVIHPDEALVELYEKKAHLEPMRVLHFTNSGRTSWCGFARAIVEETQNACKVEAITTADYPTKAVRPAFSVLSLASLAPYGIVPRSWQEALAAD